VYSGEDVFSRKINSALERPSKHSRSYLKKKRKKKKRGTKDE